MATNEDLTQPVSESYFNLSADTSELTFPNKINNLNSLSEKDLVELIERIDKQKVRDILENSMRDSSSPKQKQKKQQPQEQQQQEQQQQQQQQQQPESEDFTGQLSLSDSLDDIDIFIQSTPKTPKDKPSSKQITLNELAKMLHPVLNEEFNELKSSIKGILAEKQQKGSNLQSQLNLQSDDDISRLSPAQGSQLDLKLHFESPETTPPTSKEQKPRSNTDDDLMTELEKLRLENKMIRMENDNLKTNLKTNQQLEFKFNQSKRYNKELLNELNYTKAQNQEQVKQQNQQSSKEQLKSPPRPKVAVQTQTSDSTVPINEQTISSSFKDIYKQLNLGDIDGLTSAKTANLAKNILLKLMIDYRELPHRLDEFITIYKHMSRFINKTHNLIYDEDIVVDVDNFEKCLHDMFLVLRDQISDTQKIA